MYKRQGFKKGTGVSRAVTNQIVTEWNQIALILNDTEMVGYDENALDIIIPTLASFDETYDNLASYIKNFRQIRTAYKELFQGFLNNDITEEDEGKLEAVESLIKSAIRTLDKLIKG